MAMLRKTIYSVPKYINLGVFMEKSVCLACHNEFMYTPCDRSGKFCSRVCYIKSSTTRIEKDCSFCGIKFFHKPSEKRAQNICCSHSCKLKYKYRELRIAVNNMSDDDKLNILREKYNKYIVKTDGCWGWNSAVEHGYGRISFYRKRYQIHRLSWMLHRGPIPQGMYVLHKCHKSRICSNPDHLYLGTAFENHLDAVRDGDTKVSLNDEKVREILKLLSANVSQKDIAKQFAVSQATIWMIKNRKAWKHVQ